MEREARPGAGIDLPPTPVQVRILELLADGGTYRSIAQAMGHTEHGAHTAIVKLYAQLEVHTAGAAVAKGFRMGLLT